MQKLNLRLFIFLPFLQLPCFSLLNSNYGVETTTPWTYHINLVVAAMVLLHSVALFPVPVSTVQGIISVSPFLIDVYVRHETLKCLREAS